MKRTRTPILRLLTVFALAGALVGCPQNTVPDPEPVPTTELPPPTVSEPDPFGADPTVVDPFGAPPPTTSTPTFAPAGDEPDAVYDAVADAVSRA